MHDDLLRELLIERFKTPTPPPGPPCGDGPTAAHTSHVRRTLLDELISSDQESSG